jgi:hypothetical protein
VRIVVTGLVATYPLGGVAWDYLAYVDGFRRLGHDVLYLEDTGAWFYDPQRQTFGEDPGANLRYLTAALAAIAPGTAWAVRAPDDAYHGLDAAAVERYCRGADLFLNLSGCCWLRDAYAGAARTAYVDTDPGYTQAKLWAAEHGCATEDQLFSVDLIRRHQHFLTYAEHIGAADCRVPACGLNWRPTRPPVVLERWPFSYDAGAQRYTTACPQRYATALPGLPARLARRVERGEERLCRVAQRVVQHAQRRLSGERQAGGGAGHRMERALSDRGWTVRLRHCRGSARRPGHGGNGLPAPLRRGAGGGGERAGRADRAESPAERSGVRMTRTGC